MKRWTAVLVLVSGLSVSTRAYSSTIDFTDAYAVSNWTAVLQCGLEPHSPGPLGCGSISTADAPYSIALTSGNEAISHFGRQESQEFLFTAFETATISFAWSYTSHDQDGSFYDPFGWVLNGAFIGGTRSSISDCRIGVDRDLLCNQSGLASFLVAPGDVFGFVADSLDVDEGPAMTTISSFSATTPVPEPSSFMLVVSACVIAVPRSLRGLRAKRCEIRRS